MIDWSIGWLIDRLLDRLVDRLLDRSMSYFSCCFTDMAFFFVFSFQCRYRQARIQYVVAPYHHRSMHKLHMHNHSFGATVRLCKQWMHSMMLSGTQNSRVCIFSWCCSTCNVLLSMFCCNVLLSMFYCQCSTFNVLLAMFYFQCSTCNVLLAMFYFQCSTCNVLLSMFC